MTQDTEAGAVRQALAALSGGDVRLRRAVAEALAAMDVRGHEQAALDAFDAATDDVVRLWIAVALARAGQEVGLEELFGRWRMNPDDGVLYGTYPRGDLLAARLAAVLPLDPVATPLLEHHAAALARTWLGELALMLLGRWVDPEADPQPHDEPHPPADPRRKRGRPPRPGSGSGGQGSVVGEGALGGGGQGGGGDYTVELHPGSASATIIGGPPPPATPDGAEPASGAEPTSGAEPPGAGPATFPESAPPEPLPEPVLLGGSAPARARPGDTFLVQFAAYVAAFEPNARQALERFATPDDEIYTGEETSCRWAVGTRISVRCRADGLAIPVPVKGFVWNGQCRTVRFEVQVPEGAAPRETVIVVEAFVHDTEDAPDPFNVAELLMPVEITPEAEAGEPARTVNATPARTAFASYASEDRLDVLERASSIRRSAGLEVWMDVINLRVGDRWNPELEKHILASDRFLLFWSEHTADSPWVTWEREKAVQAKGEGVVELHLLRFTPIETVPQELRKYHFNDVYILARDAELYRREQEAKAKAAAGGPKPGE